MIVDYLLRAARIGSTWVLYLLLGLSVISVALMVERWLHFRRLRDPNQTLRGRLAAALRDGKLDEAERLLAASRTVEAGVVLRALAWRDRGARSVGDAVASELGDIKPQLERGANFLGTLGNNAPFIGLLGTVIGIVGAFDELGKAKDATLSGAAQVAPEAVMNNIAEALVATAVGLLVAIPAVAAFNAFQRIVKTTLSNTEALSHVLLAHLKATADSGTAVEEALEAAASRADRPSKSGGSRSTSKEKEAE